MSSHASRGIRPYKARPGQRGRGNAKLDEPGRLESLCEWIGSGGTLTAWCDKHGLNRTLTIRWLQASRERAALYREARQMQAEGHIDGLLELADAPVPTDDDGRTDSAAVNDKRLRIDTRKWIASKLYPALYGDRVAVDATMVPGEQQKPDEVLAQIGALFAAHGLKLTVEPADGTGDAGE